MHSVQLPHRRIFSARKTSFQKLTKDKFQTPKNIDVYIQSLTTEKKEFLSHLEQIKANQVEVPALFLADRYRHD